MNLLLTLYVHLRFVVYDEKIRKSLGNFVQFSGILP